MAAKPTSSADPKAWIKRTLPPERPAASKPFSRVSPSALSKVVGPRVVILRPTSGDRPSKYLPQTQHELPPLGRSPRRPRRGRRGKGRILPGHDQAGPDRPDPFLQVGNRVNARRLQQMIRIGVL